jgi:hypothetical protein
MMTKRHLKFAVLAETPAGVHAQSPEAEVTGRIALQKKRPKSLKTFDRVQKWPRSLPEPRWSPKLAVGKAMAVHVFPSKRFG